MMPLTRDVESADWPVTVMLDGQPGPGAEASRADEVVSTPGTDIALNSSWHSLHAFLRLFPSDGDAFC
jgi:hypothetical protein